MQKIGTVIASGRAARAMALFSPFLLALASLSGSRAQTPDAAAARLPPGPGRDSVVQTCSGCHSLGMVTGKRRSADEWSAVIQEMIGHGAHIDADHATIIRNYLTAHFSVAAATGAPPVAASNDAPGPVYPRPSGPNQWPAYGGGNANQNYSPLTQITPQNVGKLKQAWVYHYGAGLVPTGDQGLDHRFQVTPLLIGGIMYISTPDSPARPELKATITALRPETGEVIWKFESPLNIHGRGIAYWPGDSVTAPRLIFATDKGMIMAVDVTTGKLAKGFGLAGQVDAYIGVSDEIVGESRRNSFTVPNPVTIYKNLVIVSSRPSEQGPPGPRGDIRAFDARTGRHVWDFHTIPWPGEPGHEGYVGDEWRNLTGANVWSTMTLDEETGMLYAPTGDANSYVQGPQLYASSLVALDANTGKLKWFRQITHHDVWDWDSPTPVVLLDVHQDGKTIPAVALTGKHGLVFLFDRKTGEPLNGFRERPTPQPSTPSPYIWPTQPFPDAPGPIARTQMTRDEIPDLVPGMKAACQKVWDDNDTVSEPLYGLRASFDHATITYPSVLGGPDWGGGSYIPGLHMYFLNLQNRVTFEPKLAPGTKVSGAGPGGMVHASPNSGAPMAAAGSGKASPPPPSFAYKTADGLSLSCGALPWGELVAVNVDTKTIAWRTTLGVTEGIGPKGETTGAWNLGGNIATQSGLIFVGATNDRHFRAFDAKTGRKLWDTTLEASGAATPITYMGKDNKQYVVIAAGGGTTIGLKQMSDALIAFRLP